MDIETSVRSKQIDVLMEVNRRWADLFNKKIEISQLAIKNQGHVPDWATTSYYRAFWTLQLEQFFYFRAGFLPEDIYLNWMCGRRQEFYNDATAKDNRLGADSVGNVRFGAGYIQFGEFIVEQSFEFHSLIDFLRANIQVRACDESEVIRRLRSVRNGGSILNEVQNEIKSNYSRSRRSGQQ